MGDRAAFVDDSNDTRLSGELVYAGATVDDVLTVQADGSIAAAPGGGSIPAGFAIDDNATLTQTPVDQTGDSPFLNLVYDPAQLVDESDLGLVMDVRPNGSVPGDGTDLFMLGVNVFKYHSAAGEGLAHFEVAPQDKLSTRFSVAAQDETTVTIQGDTGTIVIGSDGTVKLPSLPTADPHIVNQLWNSSGALMVSAG